MLSADMSPTVFTTLKPAELSVLATLKPAELSVLARLKPAELSELSVLAATGGGTTPTLIGAALIGGTTLTLFIGAETLFLLRNPSRRAESSAAGPNSIGNMLPSLT